MGKVQKEAKRQLQQQLLGMFDQDKDHYEEKRVGNDVYIKMFNGTTQRWQVARYSKKSYQRYSAMRAAHELNRELDGHLQRRLAR